MRGSATYAPNIYGALPRPPVCHMRGFAGALPQSPLRLLYREKHPEAPKNSNRKGKTDGSKTMASQRRTPPHYLTRRYCAKTEPHRTYAELRPAPSLSYTGALPRTPLGVLFREKNPKTPKNFNRKGKPHGSKPKEKPNVHTPALSHP